LFILLTGYYRHEHLSLFVVITATEYGNIKPVNFAQIMAVNGYFYLQAGFEIVLC